MRAEAVCDGRSTETDRYCRDSPSFFCATQSVYLRCLAYATIGKMRNLLLAVLGVVSSVWAGPAAAQRQRSATEWDGESTYHFTPRGTYQHHKRSVGRVVEEKPIAGSWGCVSGPIDAAVRFDNRKQYLFFGSQYARYDMDRNACDPGYPKPIAGGWPAVDG